MRSRDSRVVTNEAPKSNTADLHKWAGNFNLDLKNPHSADDGPGDVDHLLPEYEKLLARVAETRAALKKELHQALTATAGVAE